MIRADILEKPWLFAIYTFEDIIPIASWYKYRLTR
jgi:hypothetical protein